VKFFSLSGKLTHRNVILGLMVVALGLLTLFVSFFGDRALAVTAGSSPITPPARILPGGGASPTGPVTLASHDGAGNSGALEAITLARSSTLNGSLPTAVSFNIGSCQYSSDGILHTMAVAPFLKDNQAYLPLRYMAYAIGMNDSNISWNPDIKTVSLKFDTYTVVFTLDSTIYTIDGSAHSMDVEPVVVDGYMNIPARYFAEAFGYNVIWNHEAASPTVNNPDQALDPPEVLVVVDTKIPEQLYVCRGTSVILATYCNTGIPQALTPTGVFKVFTKLPSDTMAGKNPDGSKYLDLDVPWVMYFDGGCAIHGFVRAGYGFPQSLGCVELPVETARKVYDLVPLGTKVYIR